MKNILILLTLIISDIGEIKQEKITSKNLIYKDTTEGLKLAFDSSVLIYSMKQEGIATGSGNLITFDKQNYIITANHVVDGSLFLGAIEKDTGTLPVEIIFQDPIKDIAILKPLGPFTSTTPAKFKESKDNLIGKPVVHCGHPSVVSFNISRGIITSIVGDSLIIDSFSLPGSSGSIVFGESGEIIGVVVSIGINDTLGVPDLIGNIVRVIPFDYLYLQENIRKPK